ncbi:TetR family transcriptional regulator C-terminal domain-containing protein [Actinomadura barringtoniae]|uniref:TetR family transcriptional regulator C-terminal domain-containing protein n=1 Tax=Actinomadura barringtoniae TaxID=1427535 RepID=A0A939PBN1_9ACTN|nr:TetR family transcriptional regulator C-terminal domain-containing protein [Actinomadura barringtoniae]MBO2445501.1 TetR family transcriptional regulator C-terminal domain-containing protein [Actinomadura barringtoniae]
MPKIVDPVERRRAVVDAVFRVVARRGVAQVTLRDVAAEAGLAIGSVRHYFDSHHELIVAAAREMVDRVEARVLARRDRLSPGDDPMRVVEEVLDEFLPMDAARADEIAVWLEFVVAARTDPELRPISIELHQGLRTVTGRLLARLGVDDPIETERLAALVDGLSLAGALHPTRLDPTTIRTVIRHHLAGLKT